VNWSGEPNRGVIGLAAAFPTMPSNRWKAVVRDCSDQS
jgi:hypothetical protein